MVTIISLKAGCMAPYPTLNLARDLKVNTSLVWIVCLQTRRQTLTTDCLWRIEKYSFILCLTELNDVLPSVINYTSCVLLTQHWNWTSLKKKGFSRKCPRKNWSKTVYMVFFFFAVRLDVKRTFSQCWSFVRANMVARSAQVSWVKKLHIFFSLEVIYFLSQIWVWRTLSSSLASYMHITWPFSYYYRSNFIHQALKTKVKMKTRFKALKLPS